MQKEKHYTEKIFSINNQIPKAIKDLRSGLKMTQEDLAKKAGVRREWVTNLENGKCMNPSLMNIIRVCNALGYKPGEVLDKILES